MTYYAYDGWGRLTSVKDGKPATVTRTHTATGKTTRTEVYTYTYDGKDRLTKVTTSWEQALP